MTQGHDFDDAAELNPPPATEETLSPRIRQGITFETPVWDDAKKAWRARTPADRGAVVETVAAPAPEPAVVPIKEDDFPPEYSEKPAPATERPQGATMQPIAKVRPSPTNPRKTFKQLEELAETIKAHGILQPLVARPRGDGLELVFGERRLRAAAMAGLTEVPVLIRDMSDLEVLEVQIVENVQRADVDALEEADGYKVLHEKHGYSVPDIAAKIGKSVAYVYARLKLCALGPEGRKALADGKLTDSTALLVARIPLALQADAVKELEPRELFDRGFHIGVGDDAAPKKTPEPLDPLGAREAFARIRSRFMLRLADAPFDPKDAELVPAAGACSSCPKRTGSQPELFPDVKAADTCTDPSCFETKRDAVWAKRKAEAKAAGIAVVEGKKAKEFFPYGSNLAHSSGMVDLDSEDWSDPKRRTHRERLGKRLEEAKPPVTLVRTEDGKVHELVPAKEVKKLLPKPKGSTDDARPAAPAISAAEKMKRDAERAASLVALGQVVKKVEAKELSRGLWARLVSHELHHAYGDLDNVLTRRGILDENDESNGEARERKIDVAISRLDAPALRGLYVELVLGRDVDYRTEADTLTLFCVELKIDTKQLVAKELARLKEESKKPPTEKSAAKSPLGKAALSQMPTRDAKAVTKAKKQLAKKKGSKK